MINFLLRVCWDQFVIRPDKIKLYNDCSISRGDRGLMADGLSHVIMGSVSVFTFYGFEGCQPNSLAHSCYRHATEMGNVTAKNF